MTSSWRQTIFKRGPLVYSCWLAGRLYGRQWTTCAEGPPEAPLVFDLLLEIDPVAVGMGGKLLKRRCRLTTDRALIPLRFVSETSNGATTLAFEGERVQIALWDGSKLSVPRGASTFALDKSLPGLLAIMLAELVHRGAIGAPVALEVFDVAQYAPVPYQITPGAEGTLQTSHRETLSLDGPRLLTYALPVQGVEARLEEPSPPKPDWATHPTLATTARTYTPPMARTFRLEDVRIPGRNVVIGATLTLPDKPFARAMFLGGSGTHDRHGIAGVLDIGTHTVMDTLAEAGVIGLRFDTRGAGDTAIGDDALELGLAKSINDAGDCLAYFRDRREGHDLPPFLIGHSEGSLVAMTLAQRLGEDCAGVVLMASPGRRIDEIIADQLTLQSTRNGLSEQQNASRLAELRELVRLVEEDRPWIQGQIPDYLFPALRSRRWLKQYLDRSPTALIAALRCPVLICQGEKDFQVSAERDAPRLLDAAKAAGVDVTYFSFAQLDHMFKPVAGESNVQSYYDLDRDVDQAFLLRLTDWIRQRCLARGDRKPAVPGMHADGDEKN